MCSLSMESTRIKCYTIIVKGETQDNKRPRLAGRGGKEANMKFQDGKWWHKGKPFTTLRDALLSVWPK